ncbi:MAG: hypothetical protein EA412_07235 [Chitinophagaceae bacterium]|nr:MAG: hypothetical protein EA412_07235 [Chitinophagaceae bacterium]
MLFGQFLLNSVGCFFCGNRFFLKGFKETLIYLEEDLPEAGFYSLDIPEQSESPVLAFNYDRSESEMSFVDAATLRNYLPQTNFEILEVTKFAEIQKAMVSLNFGSDFWKWCIAIALLFLAFEILLLRLWKK